MWQNIKLCKNNILVKVLPSDFKKISSGLFVPPQKEAPLCGEVLAVGPGYRYGPGDSDRVDMTVKVGDLVFFSRYPRHKFYDQGENYCILREDEIILALEPGD